MEYPTEKSHDSISPVVFESKQLVKSAKNMIKLDRRLDSNEIEDKILKKEVQDSALVIRRPKS